MGHDTGPERLKSYELVQRIGTGGMAEVYLARKRGAFGTEKLLVVKRLLPELARDERFVRMFIDEAQLAVGLHHSNIVQVHEVDEDDGVVFYAMELLHGRDVRKIRAQLASAGERVRIAQAIAIVLQVCAGLDYAHERKSEAGEPLGIVHRDVSPHNVFVCFDGVVKVIDFGIAKAIDRRERTATGVIKGKSGYMSPEQCLSQPLDRRSDVFCIAVMLYELSTGRRLYDGDSDYEILKRIIEHDAPSPRLFDPTFPEEVERILARGLRRDRVARYPTAKALAADLEAFARAEGLDVSPSSVAELMAGLFPAEVVAWRSGGRSAAAVAAAITESGATDATKTHAPTVTEPVAPPAGAGTRAATRITETLTHPRRSWRGAWVLAASVGVVALAGGVAVRRSARSADATSPSPSESAAPGAVEVEASAIAVADDAIVDAAAELVTDAGDAPPHAKPHHARPAIVRSPARDHAAAGKPHDKPDPDAPLPR